jgi:hypothetical protein
MKVITLFLVVLLVCTTMGMAQTVPIDRFAFVGAGYFDGSQVKGLAGYFVRLGDSKFFNVTETDIGMVPQGQGNLSIAGKQLQADFSTGIAYDLFAYKGAHFFALGDAGLQQTGDNPSALLKAGGGVWKSLYKNLGLAVFGRWKYAEDAVTGQAGWKVNPQAALTFRF